MNPVFPYSGGKRRLLIYILPVIPEHSTYIEPFAGGLAVFFAKPRAKVEVINDLNAEDSGFYLYVREHLESLLAEMEWYLHSGHIYNRLRDSRGLTELQKVARWYLLKVSSFSGFGDYYARDSRGYRGCSRDRHVPQIRALHERLKGVYIERRDWQQVVDFYDNNDAFAYFDPPYCTGEVGRMGAPKRREIGHGKLAWRAVHPMLPKDKDSFPYTIRVVSEIMESNGSSSMATVCGTTMSLMAAGVPMAKPVAGIAMWLIKEDDGRVAILTDILGDEDHLGDMDFKVAGTRDGVTA